MIRLRHKMLIRSMRVIDLMILVGAALAVIYFRPQVPFLTESSKPPTINRVTDSIGMLLLAFGWIGIFDYCVRYRVDRFTGLGTQLKDLLKAATLAAFLFLSVGAIFSVRSVNPASVLAFWAITVVAGVLCRVILHWIVLYARRSGYNYRYLLIIGTNERAADLARRIEGSPELGYKLVGFVAEGETPDSSPPHLEGRRILGNISELKEILERERADEMMACLSVESGFTTVGQLVQHARDLGIVLRILPDPAEGVILQKLHVEEFGGEYVVTLFREQLIAQLLVKRMVDLFVSGLGLILLSPLLLLVALVIKLTSPGPVFFSQDRVGMNQRRFKLYKFRSMVVNAEELKAKLQEQNEIDGPAFKMKNDPRITWIGRLIRKTSIDELPQLFNVLTGEMSLVGPRPPLPDEVNKYDWLFRRRLSVKPGITCVWQVSGRSDTSFEDWMQMDRHYVENWSLALDFKILLKTIPAVLLCRGAS